MDAHMLKRNNLSQIMFREVKDAHQLSDVTWIRVGAPLNAS